MNKLKKHKKKKSRIEDVQQEITDKIDEVNKALTKVREQVGGLEWD